MKHVEKVLDRIPGSERALRIAKWVSVGILIAAIMGAFIVLFARSVSNRGKIDDLAAISRARGQALGTANAKLTQAGIAPVHPTKVDPEPGNTDAGPTGAPGEDATGEPGPSGAPGRAPTADEISDAVAAYCSTGVCRGATGDTGPAGPTGPAGAAGKDGSDGADGKDAPHFTTIECSPDNTWAFTLSDGTVLHADGPCRAQTTTVTVTEPPPTPSSTTSPAPSSTAATP